MKNLIKTAAIVMIAMTSFSATFFSAQASNIEGKWFLHEFGELRSYHGDFLNVCSGAEFRTCRSVQYGFEKGDKDTFFGSTRLSIMKVTGGEPSSDHYAIEIYMQDLPTTPQGPFVLSIGGDIFQLAPSHWSSRSTEGYNVAETFTITDPELTAKLIKKMRKADNMRVLYDGYREKRFQLRGLSSALDANDAQTNKEELVSDKH